MSNNTFAGWVRLPGHQWEPVVSAADEDTAWHLLRRHVERLHAKMIDSFVGPANVDPRGRHRPGTQGRLFNGLMD